MRFSAHLLVFSTVFYGFHVSSIGSAPSPTPTTTPTATSIPSIIEGDDGTSNDGPFGKSGSFGFVERGSNSDGSTNNAFADERNDRGMVNRGAKFLENMGLATITGLGKGGYSIVKDSAGTALRLTEVFASPITSIMRVALLPLSIPMNMVKVMTDVFIAILRAIFGTVKGTWSEYQKLSDNGSGNGNGNKDTISRIQRSVATSTESSLEMLVNAPFNLTWHLYNIIETGINKGIWEAAKLVGMTLGDILREDLLPCLHNMLDESVRSNLLPKEWVPLVETFDSAYTVLQLLGYVK